jgi:recyclin-1
MKRNVLASFTNVLLLPVTIVPRTVGAFVTTSSTAAVNGIAMLNPQRWGAQAANGYSADLTGKNGDYYLDNTDLEEHEQEHEERPCMFCSPCLAFS